MDKRPAIVMWVIWFMVLQGAFAVHFVIGGGFPSGANVDVAMPVWLWGLCFAPILVATVVRWIVIPRMKQQQQLVAMVAGLALSELPIFFRCFWWDLITRRIKSQY